MKYRRQHCVVPESEEAALRAIAQEFPQVSLRIIADVLAAYCDRSPTVPEATSAARARLRDACAV